MREGGAIVVASSLAAAVVGYACLFAVSQVLGVEGDFVRALPDFTLLAIAPSSVAAALSAACFVRRSAIARRRDLWDAVRICLLAFPFLFLLLWPTFWAWLRFHPCLPLHQCPETVEVMADTIGGHVLMAFVTGIAPAICIEYFVIRFVRKRWSPALAPGVSP